MYRFMLNRLDPQGGTPEVGGRDVLVMLLNQASPTDVDTQVLGSDAVKATHPFLQAAILGIDVLYVIGAGDDTLTSPLD